MMQHIIDIVYAKVMAAIGPHNPFIDAGDIADYTWRDGDFPVDGNWHTLDLSAIIPVGTKAVLFGLSYDTPTIGGYFIFRTKGNVRTYNSVISRCQTANIWNDETFVVAPNANREVEYMHQNIIFDHIYLAVRGWWL